MPRDAGATGSGSASKAITPAGAGSRVGGASHVSGTRPRSSSAAKVRWARGRSWARPHRNAPVFISAISVTPACDVMASPIPSQSEMLGLSG